MKAPRLRRGGARPGDRARDRGGCRRRLAIRISEPRACLTALRTKLEIRTGSRLALLRTIQGPSARRTETPCSSYAQRVSSSARAVASSSGHGASPTSTSPASSRARSASVSSIPCSPCTADSRCRATAPSSPGGVFGSVRASSSSACTGWRRSWLACAQSGAAPGEERWLGPAPWANPQRSCGSPVLASDNSAQTRASRGSLTEVIDARPACHWPFGRTAPERLLQPSPDCKIVPLR